MAEKTTDRRALRTQRLLKESLAELLAEKELRRITVQEVSDRADVHRVTFYKHFTDVYDLYDQIKNEVLTKLGSLILDMEGGFTEKTAGALISYIEKNPKVFRMIFSPYNTSELKNGMVNMMEGVFRLTASEKHGVALNDGRLEYCSVFWSGGCVAIVEKWVMTGLVQPKELIIKTLFELDSQMNKLIASEARN